jgi:hypothetical protein
MDAEPPSELASRAVHAEVAGEAGPVSTMGGSSTGGVVSGAEPTGGLFPVDGRRLASSPSLLFPSSARAYAPHPWEAALA